MAHGFIGSRVLPIGDVTGILGWEPIVGSD
jgi:hypothetical protein